MFGETTISYVKIGNHPIETAIYKWLFGGPGMYSPKKPKKISPLKNGWIHFSRKTSFFPSFRGKGSHAWQCCVAFSFFHFGMGSVDVFPELERLVKWPPTRSGIESPGGTSWSFRLEWPLSDMLDHSGVIWHQPKQCYLLSSGNPEFFIYHTFAFFDFPQNRSFHDPRIALASEFLLICEVCIRGDLSTSVHARKLTERNLEWMVFCLVLNPPPNCSFARHLIGKMVIHCSFAHH